MLFDRARFEIRMKKFIHIKKLHDVDFQKRKGLVKFNSSVNYFIGICLARPLISNSLRRFVIYFIFGE